jgi:hypothetical protein
MPIVFEIGSAVGMIKAGVKKSIFKLSVGLASADTKLVDFGGLSGGSGSSRIFGVKSVDLISFSNVFCFFDGGGSSSLVVVESLSSSSLFETYSSSRIVLRLSNSWS